MRWTNYPSSDRLFHINAMVVDRDAAHRTNLFPGVATKNKIITIFIHPGHLSHNCDRAKLLWVRSQIRK
ncbi:hypothetical protein [Calothrix sp. UHCC 0171]|uniref:hypothetical protein n=1 Tax=Calothrix sp. UHCC 0171 TaxID=3110245 RepID=UPI002B20DF3B|nr:hypothetical protein [Calothrix sp. UHCC 0171]MEA5573405.1 hypothetical protein [Calothrix sp. UHCC 0171]